MRIAKDGEVRRQELLDAARALFVAKGYDNTSINDIIDAVGVSKGALYYYFASKAEILDAIALQETDRIVEITRRIAADPGLTALEKINRNAVEVQLARAARARARYQITHASGQTNNAKFAAKMHEYALQVGAPALQSIIEQGQHEGVFDAPEPAELAQLITRLMADFNGRLARLAQQLPGDHRGEPPEETRRILTFYETVLERLLGIRLPGSINFAASAWEQIRAIGEAIGNDGVHSDVR